MSDDADDRYSDGFKMIVGDEVDFDSEAAHYNSKSQVGEKVPLPESMQDIQLPRRPRITKAKRAKLRKLGFTQ